MIIEGEENAEPLTQYSLQLHPKDRLVYYSGEHVVPFCTATSLRSHSETFSQRFRSFPLILASLWCYSVVTYFTGFGDARSYRKSGTRLHVVLHQKARHKCFDGLWRGWRLRCASSQPTCVLDGPSWIASRKNPSVSSAYVWVFEVCTRRLFSLFSGLQALSWFNRSLSFPYQELANRVHIPCLQVYWWRAALLLFWSQESCWPPNVSTRTIFNFNYISAAVPARRKHAFATPFSKKNFLQMA